MNGLGLIDRGLTTHGMNLGGFDEKLFRALGIDDGSVVPEKLVSHVAAGIQRAIEQSVERIAGSAKKICLAGGLGTNALLVAALEKNHEVFVQPAAGNAGTAIGAVLHAAASVYGRSATVGLRTYVWARSTRVKRSSRYWRTASCDSSIC